ncbi:MAG: type II secretion system protein [Candidatus Roizmanbacteria bacterium]|nr:type II secretion system protein [Candidatus Roizmanbacteria bacterium]
MKKNTVQHSFTLIELMLAMVILSILSVLLIGNFNTTMKRGRDASRKNDLAQFQKALELYYENNRSYPTFDFVTNANKKLCDTVTCDPSETVYIVKVASDPSTNYVYKYSPEPTPSGGGPSSYYYLYTYLENDLDRNNGVNIKGFTTGAKCNVANTAICKYYISSSNAPQLTPVP